MNELDTFIHYRMHLNRIFGNDFDSLTFDEMASHILSIVAMPDDEMRSHDTLYLEFLHEWSRNIQGQVTARLHR